MNCQEFLFAMSAQVDGYASEHEQVELQTHLRECPACRLYAADLRRLRSELQSLESPRPAYGIAGNAATVPQLQAALRNEVTVFKKATRRREDLVDLWRTRLYSQGIGTAVTFLLLLFVLSAVFRPAYRTLALWQAATDVALAEISTDPTIRYRVMILQPPPPPMFSPDAQLLQLGQNLREGDEIIASVKVSENGHATLNYLVDQPADDPIMADKIAAALTSKASFAAPRRNSFISDSAVIVFGTVNISAHLD